MSSQPEGLYNKYTVYRNDRRDAPGADRCNAEYFVLDLMNDVYALEALDAYVEACEAEYPQLAEDLRNKYLSRRK